MKIRKNYYIIRVKSTYSSAILDFNGTFWEVNSAKRENCDSSAW